MFFLQIAPQMAPYGRRGCARATGSFVQASWSEKICGGSNEILSRQWSSTLFVAISASLEIWKIQHQYYQEQNNWRWITLQLTGILYLVHSTAAGISNVWWVKGVMDITWSMDFLIDWSPHIGILLDNLPKYEDHVLILSGGPVIMMIIISRGL